MSDKIGEQPKSPFETNKGAMDTLAVSYKLSEHQKLFGALGLTNEDERMYFVLAFGARLLPETEYKAKKVEGNIASVGKWFPKFMRRGLEEEVQKSRETARIYREYQNKIRTNLSAKVGANRLSTLDRAAQDFVSTGIRLAGDSKSASIRQIDLKITDEDMKRWSDRWSKELRELPPIIPKEN